MKWKIVASIMALTYFAGLAGQAVPDVELISRLKLNAGNFPQWERGGDLREKAKKLGRDLTITPVLMESAILCANCPAVDIKNHPEIRRTALKSDLIVIGSVSKSVSAFTTNHDFIFTDSEFTVSEIWKSHEPVTRRPVSVGDDITIAMPGGTVIFNNLKIKVSPSTQLPLRAGRIYLMFLRYISASHSYIPEGFEGFDITESPVEPLKKTFDLSLRSLPREKFSFLESMHSSASRALHEDSK